MILKKFKEIQDKFDKSYTEDGFCWQDFNEALIKSYKLALKDLKKELFSDEESRCYGIKLSLERFKRIVNKLKHSTSMQKEKV